MFCLRSWLPLLFIPTNASPLFILSFVVLTYILHRPCIYCSALLLILFASSCHWSDRCYFDLRGDWYSPRFTSVPFTYTVPTNNSSSSAFMSSHNQTISNTDESLVNYIMETMNTTTTALAGAALEEAKKRFLMMSGGDGNATAATAAGVEVRHAEWTGIGLAWFRSLLGQREWTIPCIDVKVRL